VCYLPIKQRNKSIETVPIGRQKAAEAAVITAINTDYTIFSQAVTEQNTMSIND